MRLTSPEMSPALWKQPFIYSIIWRDFKPALVLKGLYGSILTSATKEGRQKEQLLLFTNVWMKDKRSLFPKSFIHLLNVSFGPENSWRTLFTAGGKNNHINVLGETLSQKKKVLWSKGMIKRQWPVCLTSIYLLCYFNDWSSFWHVALLPETMIRDAC